MDKTPPAATLRDGKLKATIWQNESGKGPYFSTTFSRSYRDDEGEYRDTISFSSGDLLRLSELARRAHHQASTLRQRLFGQRQIAQSQQEAIVARLQKQRDQSKPSAREQYYNRNLS